MNTAVTLTKPLERNIAKGHPWLYGDAIRAPKGLATGTIVDILSSAGKVLARGLYDAGSPLAIRIYTLDPHEAIDAAFVERRLRTALAARRGVYDPAETNAFRWCNGEGDFLPGVVVDVYDRVAIVRFDGEAVRTLSAHVVSAVAHLGRDYGIAHIYERSRQGRGAKLWGDEPPNPVLIRECGVRFAVDVINGQKTGFFLDQRDNRRAIRPYAAGRNVANLFSYSGGFSVQAAVGGALRVTSVDSARGAIDSARENFRINDLPVDKHNFVCADVFEWLKTQRETRTQYDLLICDPPSFAPSEKTLQRGLNAYRDLHTQVLDRVVPGGTLAAASCSSHVTMDAFVGTLRDAAVTANRRIRLLELRGQPGDHPTSPIFVEGRYLKFVLAHVD